MQNRPYIYTVSSAAALYYTAVGLEFSKNVTDKQRNPQRKEKNSINEATLIGWITRLSGPITNIVKAG